MMLVSTRGWFLRTTRMSGSMAAGVACPRPPKRTSRERTRAGGTDASGPAFCPCCANSSLICPVYDPAAGPRQRSVLHQRVYRAPRQGRPAVEVGQFEEEAQPVHARSGLLQQATRRGGGAAGGQDVVQYGHSRPGTHRVLGQFQGLGAVLELIARAEHRRWELAGLTDR